MKQVNLDQVKIDITSFDNELSNKQSFIYCFAGCCIFTLMCILTIPFIVLDLWIANSSDECIIQSHFITLKLYLQVSGYTSIGNLVYAFFYTTFALNLVKQIVQTENINSCKMFLIITTYYINKLFYVFALSWTIVGAVLYWRDVTGCNSFTNDYIYTKLILSFIGYGLILIKNDKK